MATREQLTYERVKSLITELGEAGVLDADECRELCQTRDLGKADEVRENTPEPPALSRDKVSTDSREAFRKAHSEGDTNEQLRIIWEVLTGDDLNG